MIGRGEHAEFIIAAYAGIAMGLALVIGWTLAAARSTRRRLAELDTRDRSDRA